MFQTKKHIQLKLVHGLLENTFTVWSSLSHILGVVSSSVAWSYCGIIEYKRGHNFTHEKSLCRPLWIMPWLRAWRCLVIVAWVFSLCSWAACCSLEHVWTCWVMFSGLKSVKTLGDRAFSPSHVVLSTRSSSHTENDNPALPKPPLLSHFDSRSTSASRATDVIISKSVFKIIFRSHFIWFTLLRHELSQHFTLIVNLLGTKSAS